MSTGGKPASPCKAPSQPPRIAPDRVGVAAGTDHLGQGTHRVVPVSQEAEGCERQGVDDGYPRRLLRASSLKRWLNAVRIVFMRLTPDRRRKGKRNADLDSSYYK